MKFQISKFVPEKNEFSNAFHGVATGKDFVAKFISIRTDASASGEVRSPSTMDVTVIGETEMSADEADSVVSAGVFQTPTKKKKSKKGKRKATTPIDADDADLHSPEKVCRTANAPDEEIEAHYLGMFLYFTVRSLV